MIRAALRELRALLGFDLQVLLISIYVFGLGPALVVNSSEFPSGATAAQIIWTFWAFVIALLTGNGFNRLRTDVRTLCLPNSRAILLRAYAWLAGVVVCVPWVLFAVSARGPTLSLWSLCPALSLVLGLVVSMGPLRAGRRGTRALVTPDPHHYLARSPSQIIRMYIGATFAPMPLRSRAFALLAGLILIWALILALLWAPSSPTSRVLATTYLYGTAVGGWFVLMRDLTQFVAHRSEIYAELALLPGLGTARAQRSALYRAALGVPMGALSVILVLGALLAQTIFKSPTRTLWQAVGSMVMLVAGASAICRCLVADTRSATIRGTLLMLVATPWTVAPVLLIAVPEMWSENNLGWLSHIRLELLCAVVAAPLTGLWLSYRTINRRMHPFIYP
jgi:hypothetical protein